MKTLQLLMIIVVILFMILFVPIYVIENTIGNYLLAGFIFVEVLLFLISRYERKRKESANKPILSIEWSDREEEQSTFAPELELVGKDGKPTGIIQKYLRVRVRNKGGVARRCKAELRVTKWNKLTRAPSTDDKLLIWSGPSLEKDIAAKNGKELLNVVFSDSRFERTFTKDDDIYALISTKENLYPEAPFIRAQDGFGVGTFEAELYITSIDGSIAKSTLGINVARNFKALSMEKLS